jgi:hypothetical protein
MITVHPLRSLARTGLASALLITALAAASQIVRELRVPSDWRSPRAVAGRRRLLLQRREDIASRPGSPLGGEAGALQPPQPVFASGARHSVTFHRVFSLFSKGEL